MTRLDRELFVLAGCIGIFNGVMMVVLRRQISRFFSTYWWLAGPPLSPRGVAVMGGIAILVGIWVVVVKGVLGIGTGFVR